LYTFAGINEELILGADSRTLVTCDGGEHQIENTHS
jgi:hypothetical protein